MGFLWDYTFHEWDSHHCYFSGHASTQPSIQHDAFNGDLGHLSCSEQQRATPIKKNTWKNVKSHFFIVKNDGKWQVSESLGMLLYVYVYIYIYVCERYCERYSGIQYIHSVYVSYVLYIVYMYIFGI